MRNINTFIEGPNIYIGRGPFILVRHKHIHTSCRWKFCSYYPNYIFEKNSKHLPIPNTILTPGFHRISCLCMEMGRWGGDGNNLHSRFWMWYETLAEAQIMTWVFMDFALIVIFSSEIHIPILALLSHYFHTICLQWSPFKSR